MGCPQADKNKAWHLKQFIITNIYCVIIKHYRVEAAGPATGRRKVGRVNDGGGGGLVGFFSAVTV